ncbi:competence protein ComK [Gracilibacillus sp. YIM 98692]|uniref:competence protein ComK n=1 Tax=Gracilibacillus sp. YIM 98692 TaxID=2663532 RepID=UPI0013D07A7F|nr:competence protein ComK [Gracilibacillus sp. YIM 98692]
MTRNTLAIIAIQDIHYQVKIIEQEEVIYHTSSAISIIKENCLYYGASYKGRQASVKYHLDFQQKTPIPIQPTKDIYAFPTESPKSFTCCWFFFHAIASINQTEHQQSVIHFANGKKETFPISHHTMKKQYDRTGMVKVLFDPWG